MADALRPLWCCGCGADVMARLTSGAEVWPTREDLREVPAWKCDACGNYVGCHHRSDNPTRPLGCIPTREIRIARGHIHKVLDPIWRQRRMARGQLYQIMADRLGLDAYHTGELKSVEEARAAYRVIIEIRRDLNMLF